MKLLTYLEELGFLTTHSGAEFGWGRSSYLCVCSTLLAVTHLSLDENTRLDGDTNVAVGCNKVTKAVGPYQSGFIQFHDYLRDMG